MRYVFNRLSGIALCNILLHGQEDITTGLEVLLAVIQLLEAGFRDPDWVATAECEMREIQLYNHNSTLDYIEFLVNAAELDCNPSPMQNGLRMGLSEEMKDSFKQSHMPEGCPAYVTVCQKWDNQIRQQSAQKAT